MPFNLYDFADRLRNRGWQVPAYALPPGAEGTVVQRILVPQGFGAEYGPAVSGGLPPHGGLLRPPRGGPQPDPAGGGGLPPLILPRPQGQEGPCPFRSSETAGRRSGGCRRQPGQPPVPASAGAPARHLCRCWVQALLTVEVTRSHPEGLKGGGGHGQCHLPSPSTTRERLRRGTAVPLLALPLAWRGKLWYNERNRAGTWTRP